MSCQKAVDDEWEMHKKRGEALTKLNLKFTVGTREPSTGTPGFLGASNVTRCHDCRFGWSPFVVRDGGGGMRQLDGPEFGCKP